MSLPYRRFVVRCALATALMAIGICWTVNAQMPVETDATIDEHESLLIGAIDMTTTTLDNAERSFYLKGSVPYYPADSQRLTLETVRGFSGQFYFFVKLRPRHETTKERMYTLSVRLPSGRARNIVTFPVSTRQCGVDKGGKALCVGGLTNLGRIVVSASGSQEDSRNRFKYEFKRVRDEDVRVAFSRRFEIKEQPREPSGTVFVVRRR